MKAAWLALVGAAVGLSCGDDGGLCPHGCLLPGQTIVKITFNDYTMDRGFGGDGCNDLGIDTLHVDITNTNDATITQSADTMCSNKQVTFSGLPLGVYTVMVTPLDSSGTSLVKAPVPGAAPTAAAEEGATTDTTVNVPYDAWTTAYMGNFLFTVSWGGATCTAATPSPIVTQKLKLTVNGMVQSAQTDSGQTVNGMAAAPCHAFGPGLFENVKNLPFGPATLEVEGTDGAGSAHSESFETFVGVGMNNPTLPFDVEVAAPPDGGVDAMVDAPVVDAPNVDAMVDAAPDAP